MKKLLILCLACSLLLSCSRHHYHTVKAAKPRFHTTWYKHHRWHTRIGVGRIHIRLFEKQGTKTVKMKG